MVLASPKAENGSMPSDQLNKDFLESTLSGVEIHPEVLNVLTDNPFLGEEVDSYHQEYRSLCAALADYSGGVTSSELTDHPERINVIKLLRMHLQFTWAEAIQPHTLEEGHLEREHERLGYLRVITQFASAVVEEKWEEIPGILSETGGNRFIESDQIFNQLGFQFWRKFWVNKYDMAPEGRPKARELYQ